jgi:hypothetical protein
MKKRLIIFGCSLSASGNLKTWSDRVAEHYQPSIYEVELLNFAVPASSNTLQIKRFQEFVVNNNILPTDIIMWQVTGSERGHRRVSNRVEKDFPGELKKLLSYKHAYYSGAINYFDNKPRIDLLCHHPNCVGSHIDEEEVLQELLYSLKTVKQYTDNVLVIIGWDDAIPAEYSNKFTNFLKCNNIEYIDESILTFTKRNNLPLLPDGTHPSGAAYLAYADNMIVPKIKNLGWYE